MHCLLGCAGQPHRESRPMQRSPGVSRLREPSTEPSDDPSKGDGRDAYKEGQDSADSISNDLKEKMKEKMDKCNFLPRKKCAKSAKNTHPPPTYVPEIKNLIFGQFGNVLGMPTGQNLPEISKCNVSRLVVIKGTFPESSSQI